jgi:hypothetical protein
MSLREFVTLYVFAAAVKFIEYSVIYFLVGAPITGRVYRFAPVTVLAVAGLAVVWVPVELLEIPMALIRIYRRNRAIDRALADLDRVLERARAKRDQ